MTLTLQPTRRVQSASHLVVRREEILFRNEAPGLVTIALTVTNLGEDRSAPTVATLEAAPLGAFVPWRPLSTLPVPSLEPGESAVLQTQARAPKVAPLGPPDRVPPRRLLTALDSDDEEPRSVSPKARFGRVRGRTKADRDLARDPGNLPTLPKDLFELLGHHNVHWAGNLNVFVGRKAVERHVARALRVYPALLNMAMFVVGSSDRDEYAFHVEGTGSSWDCALYTMDPRLAFPSRGTRSRIVMDQWVKTNGRTMMALALIPPSDCQEGQLDVHVRQRSSGRTAVVEFSLDPKAAGPGCFVVS